MRGLNKQNSNYIYAYSDLSLIISCCLKSGSFGIYRSVLYFLRMPLLSSSVGSINSLSWLIDVVPRSWAHGFTCLGSSVCVRGTMSLRIWDEIKNPLKEDKR